MRKERLKKLESKIINTPPKVIQFFRDEVTDEKIEEYERKGYLVIIIEFV